MISGHMERKITFLPGEVLSADEITSTNVYEICSNNEGQEVSRGHSILRVTNTVGRTGL